MKRDSRTGSLNRKNVSEQSDDDSPTILAATATPASVVAAGNSTHQLDNYRNLIFQITWPGDDEENCSIWLVASNLQEKEAWCSDISQCIEQLHFSDKMSIAHSEVSSISMPYSVRLDPGLFKDCPDIKYRSTRNSCKMPQVRHGTLGRLLDRLLDPRFQSIDYLNTFLLTYRIFTTGLTIIAALRCVLRDPLIQLASIKINADLLDSLLQSRPGGRRASQQLNGTIMPPGAKGGRRVSTGMLDASRHQVFIPKRNLAMENVLEETESEDSTNVSENEEMEQLCLKSALQSNKPAYCHCQGSSNMTWKPCQKKISFDGIEVVESSSRNALKGGTCGLLKIGEEDLNSDIQEEGKEADDKNLSSKSSAKPLALKPSSLSKLKTDQSEPSLGGQSAASEAAFPSTSAATPLVPFCSSKDVALPFINDKSSVERRLVTGSAPSMLENKENETKTPTEKVQGGLTRQQSYMSYMKEPPTYRRAPRAGAIITSARLSRRRSSNWAAVKAFAIATAASGSFRSSHHKRIASSQRTPVKLSPKHFVEGSPISSANQVTASSEDDKKFSRIAPSALSEVGREAVLAGMTVLRVLNVARHWITKYPEDFDGDTQLKSKMQILLEELLRNPRLNVSNRKVAFQLSREILNDQLVESRVDLALLMTPTQVPSKENFDTLPALDIAEELTYLDFHIFRSIKTEELLNQVWMKEGKETKAPHVMLVTKRFNEVSKLVVSEIISRSEVPNRAACIEKWIAIADICRCLQNYNGVLQICAALESSSIHRLKNTWEVVAKPSKQSFEKLLNLVAASARFKNMREMLHRCDPPCIPFLGMYLTDLSFIEEGALDITELGLINFCKMRMLAHVLMEIRRYTQTPYMIEVRQEVVDYLLDPTRLLSDDQTYEASLTIEPRRTYNTAPQQATTAAATMAPVNAQFEDK